MGRAQRKKMRRPKKAKLSPIAPTPAPPPNVQNDSRWDLNIWGAVSLAVGGLYGFLQALGVNPPDAVSAGVALGFAWLGVALVLNHPDNVGRWRKPSRWRAAVHVMWLVCLLMWSVPKWRGAFYPEQPDLQLRFVGKEPSVIVVNESKVAAHEAVFQLGLWDMDRLSPLPIPPQTVKWIKPSQRDCPLIDRDCLAQWIEEARRADQRRHARRGT